MNKINGRFLIENGIKENSNFGKMLSYTQENLKDDNSNLDEILAHLNTLYPIEKIKLNETSAPYNTFFFNNELDEYEKSNQDDVLKDVNYLTKCPTIKRAVVMPDACPTGIIPVGTVVECDNALHPAFHSADICCSMFYSESNKTTSELSFNTTELMDKLQASVHFGIKVQNKPSKELIMEIISSDEGVELFKKIEENPFTKNHKDVAHNHLGTLGDGNHFAFLGLNDKNNLTLITHTGSRGFGAAVYKSAMLVAEKETKKIASVPKRMSWIVADSELGKQYQQALKIVKLWASLNHMIIHVTFFESIGLDYGKDIAHSTFNSHNFIYKGNNNLFYHAKGATPIWKGFESHSSSNKKIIPMNMKDGILMVDSETEFNEDTLGFAPHGAGRTMSRTKFKELFYNTELPEDVDIRFYCDGHDISEFPQAYKNANDIIKSINDNKLCNISGQIKPLGSIMAGVTDGW